MNFFKIMLLISAILVVNASASIEIDQYSDFGFKSPLYNDANVQQKKGTPKSAKRVVNPKNVQANRMDMGGIAFGGLGAILQSLQINGNLSENNRAPLLKKKTQCENNDDIISFLTKEMHREKREIMAKQGLSKEEFEKTLSCIKNSVFSDENNEHDINHTDQEDRIFSKTKTKREKEKARKARQKDKQTGSTLALNSDEQPEILGAAPVSVLALATSEAEHLEEARLEETLAETALTETVGSTHDVKRLFEEKLKEMDMERFGRVKESTLAPRLDRILEEHSYNLCEIKKEEDAATQTPNYLLMEAVKETLEQMDENYNKLEIWFPEEVVESNQV